MASHQPAVDGVAVFHGRQFTSSGRAYSAISWPASASNEALHGVARAASAIDAPVAGGLRSLDIASAMPPTSSASALPPAIGLLRITSSRAAASCWVTTGRPLASTSSAAAFREQVVQSATPEPSLAHNTGRVADAIAENRTASRPSCCARSRR